MISDAAAPERQVYVGLAWHGRGDVAPAGLLKLARQGVVESGEFAYGRRYLERPDAVSLNPAFLPLAEAAFVLPPRRLRDGGALPLTLQDALPDSWGRRVLEARQGRPLDDIDALLLTNDDRVGAMVFSSSLPIPAGDPPVSLLSLDAIAEASRQLEAGFEITPAMRELLRGGGSLGGARPKASFLHAGRRHIAKFASRADDCDMEIVEAATLALAAACGIDVPPFRLQKLSQGHALLVQRFDRVGPPEDERRLHYLSCAALLNVTYQSSDGSYVEFAQVLRKRSAFPERDLAELFRRMVFNLVVGNSDDHVKNHGMLCDRDGRWQLSPAFDLVPQFGAATGYQELAILPGQREARLALVRQAAVHFGVSAEGADEVIRFTLDTVARDAARAVIDADGDAALAARLQTFVASRASAIQA